jgi:hypothetical protein
MIQSAMPDGRDLLARLRLSCYGSVILAQVLGGVDGSEVDEFAHSGPWTAPSALVEILTGRYVYEIIIWLGD